tara:strand:- start:528 stop:1073 length:546 start_codon:yes stop_codon:yes gene_type:complete
MAEESGDDLVDEKTAEAEQVVEEVEPQTIEEQLSMAQAEAETAMKEIAYRDAEIANIRKRHSQDRSDIIRYAAQGMARRLIPLLDDFDRAVSSAPPETDEALMEGIKMIRGNLEASLTAEGARMIDASDQPFDPNTMEAITTIPAPEGVASGMVVEVLENGWMLHDRVLRPARVVVTAVSE